MKSDYCVLMFLLVKLALEHGTSKKNSHNYCYRKDHAQRTIHVMDNLRSNQDQLNLFENSSLRGSYEDLCLQTSQSSTSCSTLECFHYAPYLSGNVIARPSRAESLACSVFHYKQNYLVTFSKRRTHTHTTDSI
eukprot:Protomagalhaensia_wolfi_Nauph_80__178@NODE_109_length_3650_cov_30_485738_g82_i0_p4_GENE_NODE_109_length_3650_cov_30_485738_g82_i0NODE_109_length_3650_cov_30_485738_g82_i0_p4_ORF_typecomplete_len134_score6_30cPLA2_C2/PF18695_1/1_6e03cPLA2_C2/PF18695_1/0_042_NODE_109_length_3650_cov_30_485738_g82_i07581159